MKREGASGAPCPLETSSRATSAPRRTVLFHMWTGPAASSVKRLGGGATLKSRVRHSS